LQTKGLVKKAELMMESRRIASFYLRPLVISILWLRVGFKRTKQTARNVGDFFDRGLKLGFIKLRGFVEAGNFSDELERSGTDLVIGDGRIEIEKGLNISAH
jgi:hypothetical protein